MILMVTTHEINNNNVTIIREKTFDNVQLRYYELLWATSYDILETLNNNMEMRSDTFKEHMLFMEWNVNTKFQNKKNILFSKIYVTNWIKLRKSKGSYIKILPQK